MKLVAWAFFIWSVLFVALFYMTTSSGTMLLDCWKGCGQ
jgi:hypothetical protein